MNNKGFIIIFSKWYFIIIGALVLFFLLHNHFVDVNNDANTGDYGQSNNTINVIHDNPTYAERFNNTSLKEEPEPYFYNDPRTDRMFKNFTYNISKTYYYELNDKLHDITLNLSREEFEYYQHYDRYLWEDTGYKNHISEGDDDKLINQILNKINNNPDVEDRNDLVRAVISFVQYLPYEYNSVIGNERETTYYPYETVFKQTGVCRDTTILLIKLLLALDYDMVTFEYETANHVAVGIKCGEEHGKYGTGYCFIETTSPTAINYIPDEYGIYDIVSLDKNPDIVKYGGTRTYDGIEEDDKNNEKLSKKFGEDYLQVNHTLKTILRKMYALDKKADELREQSETDYIYKSYEEYLKTFNEYEEAIDDYNDLVDKYNRLIDD